MAQQSVFERGDTQMFTWMASVAPDSAPRLSIVDSANTVLHSATAVASGGAFYYSMFTMPNCVGWYLYEWEAFKTIAGSAYPFVNRGVFRVDQTQFTNP
jgi:hypothetical protein